MSKLQRVAKSQQTEDVRKKPQLAGQAPAAANAPLALQQGVEAPGTAQPGTILALQRQYGNQAVQRLIQTKLTAGPAGDAYEQEADRVAAQVMTSPAQPAATGRPAVQRQGEEEEVQTKPLAQPAVDEGEAAVQTKRQDPRGGFEAGRSIEDQLREQKGGGSPLPPETRAFMEPRFGADFSGVRLHTGHAATELNRAVSAQAFTHGQDIYLGEGRADMVSPADQRLLAHELTHVVQQGGAKAAVQLSRAAPTTLQRAVLTTNQLLSGLKQVPTIKDLLKGDVSLLDDVIETAYTTLDESNDKVQEAKQQETFLRQGKLRQGQSLRQHIELVLQNYEAQFQAGAKASTANAMKLVAALRTIGRALALKLHAPYAQSTITTELLVVLGPELKDKLKGGEHGDQPMDSEAFKLAGAMARDDPIGLYMQDKISLEAAADGVIAMAKDIDPLDMFNLLSQQYQIEMGAYTSAEIKKGERRKLMFTEGEFDVHENYGEISTKYFESIANKGDDDKLKWKTGGQGLDFKPEKSEALKQLKAEIERRAGTQRKAKSTTTGKYGMTAPQTRYLENLSKRETGQVEAARQTVRQFFGAPAPQEGEGLKQKAQRAVANRNADGKIKRCLQSLDRAIWAIAFKPQDLFANSREIPTEYKHYFDVMAQQVALSTVIPGSTQSIERLKPSTKRGPDYGTWRYEKDVRATGKAAMPARDLPKYGSVQVVENPQALHSIAVYGRHHFILKRKSFKNRIVFSCGTGAERKNPLLLLADMAANSAAQLTDLEKGELKGTHVEFHVFGGIQFNSADLQEIAFPKGENKNDVEHTVQLATSEMMEIYADVKKQNPTVGKTELGRLQDEAISRKLGPLQTAVLNLIAAAKTWKVPITP